MIQILELSDKNLKRNMINIFYWGNEKILELKKHCKTNENMNFKKLVVILICV